MKGAIIGDIVGSIYEFDNLKSKDFELFKPECEFTDDTVLTVAVAEALLKYNLENETEFKENLIDIFIFFLHRIIPTAKYICIISSKDVTCQGITNNHNLISRKLANLILYGIKKFY